MKVTKEKVENNQAFLSIEMEPAEIEEALDKAYHRLVKKHNVPGFRKGKAPRALLEQYIGKAGLLEDAVNHLVPEACDKAIKEQELKPFSRPEVEVVTLEPLVFKAVVPLQPVVKLGDYHSVRVPQESVELKEEEIDSIIESLRHQHAAWEPVERPVEYGDMLVMDVESHVGTQPFINQKDAQYQAVKDSPFPLPGFVEQMLQLKRGDAREFALTFPADYGRAELAGKEASFKIKVNEIKQEKLPEVNDDFAKQVNADWKSVDEMRQQLRTTLKRSKEEIAREAYERKVVDAAVDISEVEYPPLLVEEEIDLLIREQMRRWQVDDKGMEEYLKNIKKTAEELREDLRPSAVKRVRQALVLTEVAKTEKIKVSEEDIKTEIANMTKDVTEKKEEIMEFLYSPQAVQSTAQAIATRKILSKLTEIANGEVEAAPEEAGTTGEATQKEAGK